MRLIATIITALYVCGCTNCMVVDMDNADIYSYIYAPWQDETAENAAARARYYVRGAKDHYHADTVCRVVITLYAGDSASACTNQIKSASYWFKGRR